MKKHSNFESEGVYQTSPGTQPKPKRGLVAVLLVLVILFGGLASLMGILNIRLLTVLSFLDREGPAVSFSLGEGENEPETRAVAEEACVCVTALGITTETVTEFLQSYYDLPQGVYITAVEEGSAAQAAGCLPGDIILDMNGTPVTDANSVALLMEDCQPGDQLTLTLYRAGATHSIRLILE